MESINLAAARSILARTSELAQAIVARQYRLQANLWNLYGTAGRQKSLQDASYHLTYLAEALLAGDPTLWIDYAAWVKVLFAGLGFPETALADTLQWTREVLQEALPSPQWTIAERYLEAAEVNLSGMTGVPSGYLTGNTRLAQLAREYLDALLRADRWAASRMILDTVARGVHVKEIYLQVFQPVQKEIGRLWQMNQVSVAQEHFCTAATQLIMSQLYPYIFSTQKNNRRMVATCVGGELHEIGMRMVADFFEMEGWDTYYVGANMPLASVLQTIRERNADLLAISATMTFHVSRVSEMIALVRAAEGGSRLPILVGGYPFNIAPQLWRTVGADGCAGDALAAIETATQLVA